MNNIIHLSDALIRRKSVVGELGSDYSRYFPSWGQLIEFMDKSYLNGNKRAKDPHKIVCNVKSKDFFIVPWISKVLADIIKIDKSKITCHLYAGFSPNATAAPPHVDPSNVFFVTMQGVIPWRVFEDGCDYDDETKKMTTRATISTELKQGQFCYIPQGIYHAAYPKSSRVGFSFGWRDNNE